MRKWWKRRKSEIQLTVESIQKASDEMDAMTSAAEKFGVAAHVAADSLNKLSEGVD